MKTLRILVVEDDAIIATSLAETLEDLGHEICAIAATEADAVMQASTHRPDLIIADAGLSEGSGISAVATILTTSTVPHIFVTGDITIVHARMPNATVLQKPFFLPELEAAIAEALLVLPTAPAR